MLSFPTQVGRISGHLRVHGLHADIGFHLIEVGVKPDPVGAETYSVTGRANGYSLSGQSGTLPKIRHATVCL